MDPVVSVQNKNFPGETEELNEVPGADEETIPRNLAKLVKILSWNH